jgi:PRC-barrel domain
VFEAENIRDWRGHPVVDQSGDKIGDLEAVYFDTATDQPSFGTVRIGIATRHKLTFVPLDGATVGPDFLKVRYDKKLVKSAPTIDMDGELRAADEEPLFRYYGIDYLPGASGERRLARR